MYGHKLSKRNKNQQRKEHESKYYWPLVTCLRSVLICLKNRQKLGLKNTKDHSYLGHNNKVSNTALTVLIQSHSNY